MMGNTNRPRLSFKNRILEIIGNDWLETHENNDNRMLKMIKLQRILEQQANY